MIKTKVTIHCDLCKFQFGPTFVCEENAEKWIEDADEHYEEYGMFADGVLRVGQVFHVISGNRLLCRECTEKWMAKHPGN